jgi:hypothetical protein
LNSQNRAGMFIRMEKLNCDGFRLSKKAIYIRSLALGLYG